MKRSIALIILVLFGCNHKRDTKILKEDSIQNINIYSDSILLIEGRQKYNVPIGLWIFKDNFGKVILKRQYFDSSKEFENKFYNANNKLIYYERISEDTILLSFSVANITGVAPSNLIKGKVLFDEYCSRCHGVTSWRIAPPFQNKSLEEVTLVAKDTVHIAADFRLSKLSIEELKVILDYVKNGGIAY